MFDRIYPKRSHPGEAFCGHRYWKYIKNGDDAEKECFCDLDDEFCFGKDVCEKWKGAEMNKWNFKTREYEPYNVPADWNCKTFSMDMDEMVNCPHCGRKVLFGDCYTSRQIHTKHGMGFAVCGECYEKEWIEERSSE